MEDKKKKLLVLLIVLFAIGGVIALLLYQRMSQPTSPPASRSPSATTSLPSVGPTTSLMPPSSIATTSSPQTGQKVPMWSKRKRVTTGKLTLNSNVSVDVLPVLGLASTEMSGRSIYNRKTSYQWQDIKFMNTGGDVQVTTSKGAALKFRTFPLFEVSVFEYGGVHYFITRSTDCGTGSCTSAYNLVLLNSDESLKLTDAKWEDSAPLSSGGGSVAGVLVIRNKLYIIATQYRSIATSIINPDGSLDRQAILKGSFESVELEKVIPSWNL